MACEMCGRNDLDPVARATWTFVLIPYYDDEGRLQSRPAWACPGACVAALCRVTTLARDCLRQLAEHERRERLRDPEGLVVTAATLSRWLLEQRQEPAAPGDKP